MISSTNLKLKAQEFLRPIAENLGNVGITPNSITLLGFFLSALSGFLIAIGDLFAGAIVFSLSGLCDTLDGIVARVSGKKTKFGAFLDSFLDRYSDFFPLAGISFYAHLFGDNLLLGACLFSIVGSFSTSYARARAEALGIDCKVGILERPERFFILLAALLSGYLLPLLLILALLSNLTAFQRLICALKELS